MEENKTNEYSIKFTGSANIPRPLKNGFGYDLEMSDVEVRKIERIPNDDGTENEIATLKVSELTEVILKSGDKVLKATGKGSQARVVRRIIEDIADRDGLNKEQYYKKRMSEHIEELKDELYLDK